MRGAGIELSELTAAAVFGAAARALTESSRLDAAILNEAGSDSVIREPIGENDSAVTLRAGYRSRSDCKGVDHANPIGAAQQAHVTIAP